MTLIDVTSVSKTFWMGAGARHVLEDVSLKVERGEFVSIVGFMGCGKSTLLNIIAGLAPADTGTVRLGGKAVEGVLRGASIVFQNYSLLPWFSAIENVRLAVATAFPALTRAQQIEHARRALEKVGLGNSVDRRPSQLSGGMRQRVAIARAFATEPEILLLDEPFGALDALTRGNLQQELAGLCSERGRPVTTVMVTNSVDEALLLSDRIVPMTRGPRATLGTSVSVDIARPRSLAQLLHDEHAVHVRSYVVESLTDSVRRARRRRLTRVDDAPAGEALAALPRRSEA
ncbi:MAG: nitrate ABC transporter ATP-binding protein [Acidobacteria bacterium]|nr:MAG: nitrate ABC transporter ATP-binding protein [Acidobacteriota bacterium]